MTHCLIPRVWIRYTQYLVRDWSLITGRGATKREGGGHMKFYPYEKGGQKKFWGRFYVVA